MGQHLEGWLPQSKFQQIQEIPWAINGQRLGRIRERRCICLPWSYCFLGNCLGLLLEMKCCWGGLQAGVSTARLGLRGSNRQPVLQVSQFLVQILLQHKGGRFLLFIMSSLCVCFVFFLKALTNGHIKKGGCSKRHCPPTAKILYLYRKW